MSSIDKRMVELLISLEQNEDGTWDVCLRGEPIKNYKTLAEAEVAFKFLVGGKS